MSEQDLPELDKELTELTTDIRKDLAEQGRRNLFFFGKAVLGYKDMTVNCHGPLCTFIDHNTTRFKLILMPRDHYKTSVVTIGSTLQKIVKDTNQRILVANESATNAERMLRAIRLHAETNKVFRTLYSEVIPKDTRRVRWNDSELDFVRTWVGPEPTVDTIGMTGAVTSRHYTHMVFDDPISEEAVKSEKVMTDTINRMSAVLSLLSKPETDSFWLVGTRWALHDVYSHHMRLYGDRMAKFIRGAVEDGEPIFPELISLETLALKRASQGEYKYSCLMMNNPRNVEIQDLNVDDLKWYALSRDGDTVILYGRDGQVEREIPIAQLDVTTTVDLAPAEKLNSDRNAVVTIGCTPSGEAIVLDAWARRCTPLELMEKLFELKERWHPRVFGIEDIAYQKAFKHFLKSEADRRGLYLNVVPLKAVGKKELRIRGLQPIMATGRLYLDPKAMLLRQEMADFPLGEHDDVLDALSMQQQVWRGIMSPERWAKYRESEKRLFRRMAREGSAISSELWRDESQKVLLISRPPIEEDDAEPLPQDTWTDYVIT